MNADPQPWPHLNPTTSESNVHSSSRVCHVLLLSQGRGGWRPDSVCGGAWVAVDALRAQDNDPAAQAHVHRGLEEDQLQVGFFFCFTVPSYRHHLSVLRRRHFFRRLRKLKALELTAALTRLDQQLKQLQIRYNRFAKISELVLIIQAFFPQCCGAGAGSKNRTGSTIDEKLNNKIVPQKFTEDTTCKTTC